MFEKIMFLDIETVPTENVLSEMGLDGPSGSGHSDPNEKIIKKLSSCARAVSSVPSFARNYPNKGGFPRKRMDKEERLQLVNSTIQSLFVANASIEILKDRTKNTEFAEFVEKAQKALTSAFADVVQLCRLHGYHPQFNVEEIVFRLE